MLSLRMAGPTTTSLDQSPIFFLAPAAGSALLYSALYHVIKNELIVELIERHIEDVED